jgi:hypothetical protein
MASHEGIDRKCAVSAQIAPLVRLMENLGLSTAMLCNDVDAVLRKPYKYQTDLRSRLRVYIRPSAILMSAR